MKYRAALLVFIGGYLAQASRLFEGSSAYRISSPADRSRNSNGQAISFDHNLTRRSFVLARDDEGSIQYLLPRTSRGSPKSDRRERNRPPSQPRPGINVAAVTPAEQQHQQQPQNRQQPQRPTAHTPLGNAPPRIRTPQQTVNTPMNFRGRFGAFSHAMAIKVGRKQPAKPDRDGSPIAQIGRLPLANRRTSGFHPQPESPSPPKSPKSPKPSGSNQTPNSPNTMLERERSWLRKGKWMAGFDPFHNNPSGMSGAYVAAAGEYEPPTQEVAPSPRSQRSVSPAWSAFSSHSSGLSEPPSSPPVRATQMAAFPAQQYDPSILRPWQHPDQWPE